MKIDDYVRAVLENRREKQSAWVVGELPPAFCALADAIEGVQTEGKLFALDLDYLLHIMDRHGGAKEIECGQIPVVAGDFEIVVAMLEQVVGVAAGHPPVSRNGGRRLVFGVESGGIAYEVVLEVRRRYLVPFTLWKRRK
jgi:hypothetical protein